MSVQFHSAKVQFSANSIYIPILDIAQCLQRVGENIPSQLDAFPPLCKHHYHMVYNTYKPTAQLVVHGYKEILDHAKMM